MISATSDLIRYQTTISDDNHQGISDVTLDKGGSDSGFGPHQLLEAALATCVNITVRIYADTHAIPLRGVTTNVTLDKTGADDVVFRYDLVLDGELTPEQESKLQLAAKACPVRRTLSKKISFESGVPGPRT